MASKGPSHASAALATTRVDLEDITPSERSDGESRSIWFHSQVGKLQMNKEEKQANTQGHRQQHVGDRGKVGRQERIEGVKYLVMDGDWAGGWAPCICRWLIMESHTGHQTVLPTNVALIHLISKRDLFHNQQPDSLPYTYVFRNHLDFSKTCINSFWSVH